MNKPSNKDLQEMLRASFADATPDKAEEIVAAAKNKNNVPTVSITQENLRGKYLKVAGLIAASIVIVTGLIFVLAFMHNNEVYSTVLIENDACFEISLNRENRPVSISGMDNVALRLSKRIDKGATLEEAVDNTLDVMIENDNLGENANTVLVTADAPDDPEVLLNATFEAVKDSFADDDFDGAILTTVASEDRDIQRMARRHRISVGKAEMITDILKKDKSFSAELLSRLSVNDLNLLTTYRGIRYDSIGIFGVSDGCISPEDAIRLVCNEMGFSDDDVDIRLGADSYGLIYSVTVHSDRQIYIYRVAASSGEIIAVSQGEDLKTAQMADQNTPSPTPDKNKGSATTPSTEKPDAPKTANMAQDNRQQTAPQTEYVYPNRSEQNGQSQQQTPAPTSSYRQQEPQNTPPTAAPQQPKPTTSNSRYTAKPKPTSAPPRVNPTSAPKPTQAPQPTQAPRPTEAPKPDPAVFTAKSYLSYNGGVKSNYSPASSAKSIPIRRVLNGFDLFYDKKTFPYSPVGKQGGISALVCNREQFYRLTGSADSRYDDSYFKTHALYIHMNRDANYHWIKSISAAYMDGGVLCLQNSESIGYYIPGDGSTPERIYTVAYELNKSDLKDFSNLIEYTD